MSNDLTSFLSDISSKDELLRKASSGAPRSSAGMAPIRGKQNAEPARSAPPRKKAAAAAVPRDDAAIWDEDDAAVAGPQLPGAAAAPDFVASAAFSGARPGYIFKTGGRGLGYYADGERAPDAVGGKGSHRKHAYEYFSEWDRFDGDGELKKLDSGAAAAGAGAVAATKEDEGLPPGLTAEMLRDMPRVEVGLLAYAAQCHCETTANT